MHLKVIFKDNSNHFNFLRLTILCQLTCHFCACIMSKFKSHYNWSEKTCSHKVRKIQNALFFETVLNFVLACGKGVLCIAFYVECIHTNMIVVCSMCVLIFQQ